MKIQDAHGREKKQKRREELHCHLEKKLHQCQKADQKYEAAPVVPQSFVLTEFCLKLCTSFFDFTAARVLLLSGIKMHSW